MAPRVKALLAGLSALLTLPVAGCYGDVEAYSVRLAKFSCQRLRECNKSAYVDEYDEDMGKCRQETEDDILDFDEIATNLDCEYDPVEGRECAHAVRALRKDCSDEADDDIIDACDRVYMDCLGLLQPAEPAVTGLASRNEALESSEEPYSEPALDPAEAELMTPAR